MGGMRLGRNHLIAKTQLRVSENQDCILGSATDFLHDLGQVTYSQRFLVCETGILSILPSFTVQLKGYIH